MDPDSLVKDELQYEICIRGIRADADVRTLTKVCRSVFSRDLPVELSNVRSLCVEDLYGSVASKIVELLSLVT
jgi:hypothetical protein